MARQADGEIDLTHRMTKPYRILLLDTKGSNPNHYICLAIERALRRTPNVELVVKANLGNAIVKAIEADCNVFFAFDGEELDRTICARLAQICGPSVLWVTEDPYETSANLANAHLFDLIFTNDSASVEAYGSKGRHLPLAGAKDFHFLDVATSTDALRYDVFFAGTAWPNRVALLKEFLEVDWKGHTSRVKIALPTNEHLPAVKLDVPRSQLDWRMAPVDFARFANMSTSTLVLPRVFSASGDREFAETPPPRLYEAALAGTVQLVQSNIVEADRYFEPGEDFLYFDGASDLIEHVRALRNDIDWRSAIARRAQEKALRYHCYEHRVAYVLDELAALPSAEAATYANSTAASKRAVKPRLLVVAHNVLQNGHFGGVEVYLSHMRERFGKDYEIYFYVPARQGDANATVLLDAGGNEIGKFTFSRPTSPWQLSCTEREEAFSSVLVENGIAAVHFHHLLGHVPSLVEIAKSLGVASLMTFHDYYAICHNFTLLSFKGAYCRPDEIDLSQCDVCLWSMYNILPGGQAARRVFWDRIIAAVDVLVFNTQGGYDLMSGIYPSVAGHKHVEILPVPVEEVGRTRPYRARGKKLKVAILGNFAPHKGANVIARVIPLMRDSNVEFHIFGRVEGSYSWLGNSADFPYVHVHGGYQPDNIPTAVRECDVSLHLSIWPETYCLTLSEAWDFGLVPIVSDIGALGERVTDGINGIKIPPDSESALLQALHRLSETPGLVERLREGAVTAPISRMDHHFASLGDIYKPLVFQRHVAAMTRERDTSMNFAKLRQPIVSSNWAITPGLSTPVPLSAPTFRRRLKDLAGRAARHYRAYGMFSTARACVRYVARRI